MSCTKGSFWISASASRWRSANAAALRRAGVSVTAPICTASVRAGSDSEVCSAACSFSRAAGWLSDQRENAFVGSAGPTFNFGKLKFPLTVEIGCSPTVLSRYRFGETDLGFPVQFTSHIGAMVELGSRVSLSYRLQHMSNASLSQHNPGLDLHSIGVSYRF